MKKIFVISLARSEDRREHLLREITKIQDVRISIEFFNAVDARNNEHLRFRKHCIKSLTKCYLGRDLTDAEKGCFASHYCLWQKCVEMNEPIIVMEDDVDFADSFREGIERIYNSHYGYVRLRGTESKKVCMIEEHFGIAHFGLVGTQGYYLTPKVALKFLHKARFWLWPVDDYMDKSYINKVPNMVHLPYLLNDKNLFESTIDA
ncbi:MAG: glycosyltransferase family 25 protein, partial [Abditibacteriaceae bacterium]